MQAGREAEILATNLRVLSALHRVLDLLRGLPVVVFKGPVLTQRAYGHLGGRASADNDLWVPAASSRSALARLLEAGFSAAPHIDPERALAQRGQVALWPDGDASLVSVDLHERPFARPYFEVDDEVLSAHVELDSSTGCLVETFDLPLSFCHAVAHYVQHHLAGEQLELIGRLWSMNVGAASDVWSGVRGLASGSPDLLALVDSTCGRPAAELALQRFLAASGAATEAETFLEAGRARQVARVLAYFRDTPPGVVRKFLALYLTAPERLLSGAWDSAFPANAVLHERYGLGRRPWLLLRHLARVLTER